jgi:uncharacterized LabA/DUF88 family protein
MKPSAVLLIDLENFYCSREDYCRSDSGPLYDRARFAFDLEKLLNFVREMTAPLQFTVRRAYANYNTSRFDRGTQQFYLRNVPDELLRQGVEPVQVFRLSAAGGRGSKNAADMRMAMDATALLNGSGNVEHFVLVTGDADFIPVILELKRHGHTVSVIGVTGATNQLIQRFVDHFELFEDLLAAEEVESRSRVETHTEEELTKVISALRQLLLRSRPIRSAALKPLLTKELGKPFDVSEFGCDTTVEFLRTYQSQLGIVLRQTPYDQDVDLPGPVPALAPAPITNGVPHNGTKTPQRAPEKPPQRSTRATPVVEPHSVTHYKLLLSFAGPASSPVGAVRVPAVPWSVLVWCSEAVIPALVPPTGSPATSIELLPRLAKTAKTANIPNLEKQLTQIYPILRAALPAPSSDGVYKLPADSTPERLRRKMLHYIASVLERRLQENGIAGTIHATSLAGMFDPGAALGFAVAEITDVLANLTHEPPTTSAPAQKSKPQIDEVHNANNYRKLLHNGGVKGTDTEHFRIQPVLWSSVERVCEDTFAILSAGSLPRNEYMSKLTEAGQELCVVKYDQHVRRAVGMLRLAGAIDDENDPVKLHPDLTEAWQVRAAVLETLLNLLCIRLEEKGIAEPIHAIPFLEAIDAGPATEQLLPDITRAIECLYQPAPPATQQAEPQLLPIPEPEPELQSQPANNPTEDEDHEFDGSLPDYVATAQLGGSGVDLPAITSAVVAEQNAAEARQADHESPELLTTADDAPTPNAEPIFGAIPEEPPVAVPVADWFDADPLEESRDFAGAVVAASPATIPPPFPAELAVPVTKIIPPPLPPAVVQPPPLPPLPPESA